MAAELGVPAFRQGFAAWSGSAGDDDLAPHTAAALAELRAAAASLG